LTKLAAQDSKQSFVQKTRSIELWDDAVPREKIKAMSEYLEDVSAFRLYPLVCVSYDVTVPDSA
jgi:hypothetical protein